MHKNIHFSTGIEEQYHQDVLNFVKDWNSNKDEIIVQTSGSTGTPKTIRLKKSAVKKSALATGKFFDFKVGQKTILNLSPNYIAGKLMIVRALVFDMELYVLPNSRNPLLDFDFEHLDFAAFVPYQVDAILNNPQTRTSFNKIINVIIGGAPINHELEQRLLKCDNQSFASFGMTETITHFALRSINEKHEYYTCLPGFNVTTNKNNGLVLEKNAITNKLETNDWVELLDDSRFIWKGRLDHIINSGGVKLSPENLERKIADELLHRRFYFIGRPSEKFGEELILYVEGSEIDDLADRIKPFLAKYELPKSIYFVPAFKETPTGKVKRVLF